MKQLFGYLLVIGLLSSLFSVSSCTKKGGINPSIDEPLNESPMDINKLNIPVSKGDIGIIIDTRSIAKLGYLPSYVQLDIGGALSGYSKKLEINEFTNQAVLTFKKDSLTNEEINEFEKGVPATIKVYDDKNSLLAEKTIAEQPVNTSAIPIKMESTKKKKKFPLKIISGAPYIIVADYNNGKGKKQILTYTDTEESNDMVLLNEGYSGVGDGVSQNFILEPAGNDSTFYIKATGINKYIQTDGDWVTGYDDSGSNPPANCKFILSQDDDGWITIKTYQQEPVKLEYDALFTNAGVPVRFRLISADIEWSVEDMGIAFDNPILPPAKLDFAVNTTIKNCANVTVRHTIGKEDTRTTTITSGWEESFSVTNQHEARVDMSVTVGASVDLFGVAGVNEEYSVSAGYTYTHSSTETNTNSFEASNETQTVVSWQREIEIPPYTAIDAYDAVQTYTDVSVPYVQKLRVSGKIGGRNLTDSEIISQLIANRFGGVVTQRGSTYAVITVRGTFKIHNLMDTRTDVTQKECDK